MNKAQAIRSILSLLSAIHNFTSQDKAHLRSLSQGKLYEFYVLARLVTDLRQRGFCVQTSSQNIHFKQAPGKLHMNDPHFLVQAQSGPDLHLFIDVEFETLGCSQATQVDLSALHELDLVLVQDAVDNSNPTFRQVLLAVECKSNAFLKKSFVREALGLRRELSYLVDCTDSHLSEYAITHPVRVPAWPASEFWLAFTHDRGTRYQNSPAAFGVELRHIPVI